MLHNRAIKLPKAKVHVYSDSVLLSRKDAGTSYFYGEVERTNWMVSRCIDNTSPHAHTSTFFSLRAQEKSKKGVKRAKNSPFCHADGHLSPKECRVGTKISEIQRPSCTPR